MLAYFFYDVVKLLPILLGRKSKIPDSVNNSRWQVFGEFFSKHRNRLFWKGKTSKARYRVDEEGEGPTIFHLEYTSKGVSIPNLCLVVVSRGKALDILHDIA